LSSLVDAAGERREGTWRFPPEKRRRALAKTLILLKA
jgi:hypothetical protein